MSEVGLTTWQRIWRVLGIPWREVELCPHPEERLRPGPFGLISCLDCYGVRHRGHFVRLEEAWRALNLALMLAAGLLCGEAVLAQEPTPAPTPKPCDSAVTPCWTVERWVLGIRVWNQGHEPEMLAGGRGQVEVRYKRFRFGARADGTATAGQTPDAEFDMRTVRDVEAHVAVSWDALRLPGGVAIGPMVFGGVACTLPQKEGERPTLLRSYAGGVGAAGAWPGGRIQVGCGAVFPFERGLGCASTWQLPIDDHVANIGWFSYGRRTVPDAVGADGVLVPAHGEATSFVWTGIAVKF